MILWIGINYKIKDNSFDERGNMGELWVISVTLFTNILLIVTTDLLIFTKYHTWINFMILGVVTVLAYVLFILIVHNVTFFNSVRTVVFAFSGLRVWLMFFFVCATCGLIDFAVLSFHCAFGGM